MCPLLNKTYPNAIRKTKYNANFWSRGMRSLCKTVSGRRKIMKSVTMLRPAWLQKTSIEWQYDVGRLLRSQNASMGTQMVQSARIIQRCEIITMPKMILAASRT